MAQGFEEVNAAVKQSDFPHCAQLWFVGGGLLLKRHLSHAENLDRFLGRKNCLTRKLTQRLRDAVSAYAGVLLTPLLTPPYAIAGFAYAASI